MKGTYEIIVQNRRVQYKFSIRRNITILKGDSATGKTTLIEMIAAYQQNKERSGVNISCNKPCVVLSGMYWKNILSEIKDSIVFIDEGEKFVSSIEFAKAVQDSDNYYVIATRTRLLNLAYSVEEIYGICNYSGNRYQGTKKLYSKFYPLNSPAMADFDVDAVLVEDSNSGFEFFKALCEKYGIECLSANGNGNIYSMLHQIKEKNILVVADGAAFGQEIERVLSLNKIKNILLYLPECFEWVILKSGIIDGVQNITNSPSEHIESSLYYTWERFFTSLLIDKTQNTYLKYSKSQLNKNYLNEKEYTAITKIILDSKE